MIDLSIEIIAFFVLLSLGASIVNGGMGYGFSSISIPLAILVFVNKIVNPVYVIVEAIMNTVMLAFSGKENIKVTFRRVLPVILPLVPGVIIGSYLLSIVAPLWIRFIVYAALLPLILLQAAGIRRPIRKESLVGVPLGFGTGLLYSITTISGPPIALFWNNQGMKNKEQFKAAIAQIRIAESYLTLTLYYFLGLFTLTTLQLLSVVAPPILLGIPLGIFLARRIAIETFRRICMSFDAAVVGFGLSQVLISLFNARVELAYSLFAAIVALDLVLFRRYLKETLAEEIRIRRYLAQEIRMPLPSARDVDIWD